MGRPCYLVISAIENRVTGVTGAPRFPHVSTNANWRNVIRTSREPPADDSSAFVVALSPDERRDLNEVNDAVKRPALPGRSQAERVGFADATSFRKAFRKWTGHSPTHCRRPGSDTVGMINRSAR
jgi:hypothetical protein